MSNNENKIQLEKSDTSRVPFDKIEDEMKKVFSKLEAFRKVIDIINEYKDTIPEDRRDTLKLMYTIVEKLQKEAEDLYMKAGVRNDTDVAIVQGLQQIGEKIDYNHSIVEYIGFRSINTAERAKNPDDENTKNDIETLIDKSCRYKGGCSCRRIYTSDDIVKFEVTCFLKLGLYHP